MRDNTVITKHSVKIEEFIDCLEGGLNPTKTSVWRIEGNIEPTNAIQEKLCYVAFDFELPRIQVGFFTQTTTLKFAEQVLKYYNIKYEEHSSEHDRLIEQSEIERYLDPEYFESLVVEEE